MPTTSPNLKFNSSLGKSLAKLIYDFAPFKDFDFNQLTQKISFLSLEDLKTLKDYARFLVADSSERLKEMQTLVKMTSGNTALHISTAVVMHQRFYLIQMQIYDLILKKYNDEIQKTSSQFCLLHNGLSPTLKNNSEQTWSFFSNNDSMQNLM